MKKKEIIEMLRNVDKWLNEEPAYECMIVSEDSEEKFSVADKVRPMLDRIDLEEEIKSISREDLMERSTSLIITDASGIYIPQIFCQNIREEVLEQQDKQIKQVIEKLAKENSHEDEWYWEYWDTVLGDLEYTIEGVKYSIYQSGNLWEINHRYYDQLTEEEIERMWV